MIRMSVICVRWYPTFVPVFVGVWFFILFSIVYRAQFPYKHVSIQKRISETFVFDIEYDSTKHSDNTIFHVEPWNYDYDSDDELLTTPSSLKVASTRTYSVSTSAKITASSSTERSSALPPKEPTELTTKFQGRTFQKIATLEIYDSKFTDEFDHGVSRDILDLLPVRTHILDMSIPEKDVKYNAGRIFHQLNHVSIKYNSANVKVVYLSGKQGFWHHPPGMAAFEQCRIKACKITYDTKHGADADAVVFSNPGQLPRIPPFPRKSPNQVWAVSMIECPMNSRTLKKYNGLFNWTMTYRTDSVIETPYFKYQKYKDVYTKTNITTNYANRKTKKVAWLVSNCMMTRSGRMAYAKKLAKYIEVDIYGACGTKRCPQIEDEKCMRMLETDYKFYLAFENTKCLDYVTEKAVKALKNKVIPIVLGAPKATYQSILPSGSFIHVEDFRSPEELAQYLHKLDKNDTLYNEYFRWREEGEFIETKPWCRLCGLLHEPLLPPVWYNDIEQWWRPKDVCIGKSDWADTLS
ncbi:glycoprotein 3-alpha-L-fucosyltransferase A-like [Mizuhopecten yessoensis]|uniref:glycoprotein 3-alpha-L-fucosyltransferase A-like n=1 Tax=Mizuhopecten yessoensis TaxID=6573 RepID=UPI000B45F5DD|nr:glycoprotein 3-alpha-L-fucosyltransferase A-like [Mizuhopecten yessoensis]